MMNKIFDDSVLRRKILLIVNVIAIVNTISLMFWYGFKIKPTFIYNENVKRSIQIEELQKDYDSVEELENELERISKKYNTEFRVVDDSENEVMNIQVQNAEFFLFSDVVTVGENVYIVNAYLHRNFSITSITISLIAFQIFVIFILMMSTYFATGRTIINPIQRIVDDIRDYKFGKKPTRNEVNTELDIIHNEFVNLVDSLEEEKSEQNRIIASISHDIKTPLTSIMGYSALLDDDNLSQEEVRQYSVKINEKAKHIKNILETFDDYLTSYDNKKLKLDNVMIKDIVKDLTADYKVELESKNISFKVTCKCSDDVVIVDVLKLKRIFSNIISNSLRYIPEAGEININITSDEKFAYFTVKDNGCGVNDELIDKIFDPFFTTDQSRRISGLGLSICKEFVELQGGSITAKNDNGFVIEFTVPIGYKKKSKKNKKF